MKFYQPVFTLKPFSTKLAIEPILPGMTILMPNESLLSGVPFSTQLTNVLFQLFMNLLTLFLNPVEMSTGGYQNN